MQRLAIRAVPTRRARRRGPGAVVGALSAVALLLGIAVPDAEADAPGRDTGPELTTDRALLDGALDCPETLAHPERDPVLLVHGTATDAEASFPWSLEPVLAAAGYDTCTLDLPGRALVDIQVSSEYVVHAVRHLDGLLDAAGSDRLVDVVGHSQGTLQPRWAARWWPDVRASMDDLVQMAPPNQGTRSASAVCAAGSCAPAAWQLSQGSALLAALNTDDPVPDAVDVTAVVSLTDDLVQPAPAASALPGSTQVVLQELCPGRYVNHVEMLADAVAVWVLLDALAADGPADVSRFDDATCLQTFASGTDPVEVVARSLAVYANGGRTLAGGPRTEAEPALADYTSGADGPGAGGRPDHAGRPGPGHPAEPGRPGGRP